MVSKLLRALLGALALTTASMAGAQPATLPPLVRLVVPFTPGASTDVAARAVAAQLGARLGTNVIVDNRPGASGMIGATAVAKAPPDGSMLLFTSVSLVTTAAAMRTPPLDVNADLVPVAIMGETPLIIVVPAKSRIRSPADLVAAARAKPDELTHGTAGVGTTAHMAAELLNDAAKVQLRHIPYKGASLALVDLVAERLDLMLAVNSTFGSQIKAGALRAIAVTSTQPNPAFPGVAPMASAAPGYEVDLWTAVFAPRGTPAPLVERVNRELNQIAASKEFRELLASDGGTPLTLNVEESGKRVREAYEQWKKLAAAKKIVAE